MFALVWKNACCLISKRNSPLRKSRILLPILFHNFSTSSEREAVTGTAIYDVLVNKHQFSSELASLVSSGSSTCIGLEKVDSILSFLKDSSFSRDQVEKIVKSYPRILQPRVEDNIYRKIKTLMDFGFSPEDIAEIACKNNLILRSSAEKKIIPQLAALKGLMGSNYEVVRLVKRLAWYMTRDLDKTVVPNVELLKRCGISMENIYILLYNFPRCLLVKPGAMGESIEKAKEMGVNPSSKMFVYAVRVIASLNKETLKLKMQGYRDLGVSDSDILAMFRKAPLVLAVSMEKVKNIKEILLATGKFDTSSIFTDPAILFRSIDKRYKPRLQVLKILESKDLIKTWPSLSTICKFSDDKFFERFVRPYSDELGEVYFSKCCVEGKGINKK